MQEKGQLSGLPFFLGSGGDAASLHKALLPLTGRLIAGNVVAAIRMLLQSQQPPLWLSPFLCIITILMHPIPQPGVRLHV